MTAEALACPLCDLTTDDLAERYRHLQVGHRKSALANELLDSSVEDASEPLFVGRPEGEG